MTVGRGFAMLNLVANIVEVSLKCVECLFESVFVLSQPSVENGARHVARRVVLREVDGCVLHATCEDHH